MDENNKIHIGLEEEINIELSLWALVNDSDLTEENRKEIRNYLINNYLNIALSVASAFSKKYRGNISTLPEIQSDAYLGLLNAFEKYDHRMKKSFKSFAEYRIKGALKDGMRKKDRCPRRLRELIKKIRNAQRELEEQHGTSPTPEQVREYINVSEKVFNRAMRTYSNLLNPVNLDDSETVKTYANEINIEHLNKTNPEELFIKNETIKRVREVIDTLPGKERLIIRLVFYKNMKIKEIAEVINTTPQRVSQIYKKAHNRLKIRLKYDL